MDGCKYVRSTYVCTYLCMSLCVYNVRTHECMLVSMLLFVFFLISKFPTYGQSSWFPSSENSTPTLYLHMSVCMCAVFEFEACSDLVGLRLLISIFSFLEMCICTYRQDFSKVLHIEIVSLTACMCCPLLVLTILISHG